MILYYKNKIKSANVADIILSSQHCLFVTVLCKNVWVKAVPLTIFFPNTI